MRWGPICRPSGESRWRVGLSWLVPLTDGPWTIRSQVSSAVNYSRAYNLDPTDLVTGYDSSLDSATDVIVRDQDYVDYCGITWHSPTSGGTIGLATCDSRTGLKCEQHTVRFDLSYIANATTSEERGLACHELGHSVGLTHRDSECGCMKSSHQCQRTTQIMTILT